MLKMRVTGLPAEVKSFVDDFKEKYRVLQVSDLYPNRNNEYTRVYIDFEHKGENK